ncbi:MAG: thiamine diphosphokinase [Firmicutes bacterium]|nr:thiamine diphosphokinase [Bacillota bacterium]
MRTVIFGGGEIKDYGRVREYIQDGGYIICADGGYDHALAMGIKPDLLIGDFDSISAVPDDIKTVRYPVKKDMTDSEIALETAIKTANTESANAAAAKTEILLFGFTGDRADHTLANMLLLLKYKNAVIIDDNNEIRPLCGTLEINGRVGQTVSIIPVNGDLRGVVTEGLEYPLNGETLRIGESRGVSNVMTGDTASISCKEGQGLVIKVEKV